MVLGDALTNCRPVKGLFMDLPSEGYMFSMVEGLTVLPHSTTSVDTDQQGVRYCPMVILQVWQSVRLGSWQHGSHRPRTNCQGQGSANRREPERQILSTPPYSTEVRKAEKSAPFATVDALMTPPWVTTRRETPSLRSSARTSWTRATKAWTLSPPCGRA